MKQLLQKVIDFKRVQAVLSKRSTKYGANTTLMILIVLAIIILVEVISSRHDSIVDLTKNKRYTLSEQTKKILTALEKDVNVVAFFTIDQAGRGTLEDLLKQYSRVSSQLKYEFVDPYKNPARTRSYEISTEGTIVLETSEKQEKMYEPTEEALTNALIKVTREGKKSIYFVKGHGEHDLQDDGEKGYGIIKKALQDANYEVQELLLMQEPIVPEDAAVVIVGGPQKDLLPTELETLKTYIQGGGNVLFMLDPEHAPETAAFLKAYGVVLGDNTVIDTNPLNQMFGAGYGMPIVSSYEPHPITEKFNMATIFPLTRSVEIEDTLPEGVSGQSLADSAEQSWAETSKEELQSGNVSYTEGDDQQGPISLGAVFTVDVAEESHAEPPEEGEETEPQEPVSARVVVFGDSDFASNAYIGWSGNGDLFLNTLNWLAKEEDLVAIRAKDPEMVPLMLTAAQGRLAFLLAIVILPLAVITAGVTVYVNRRKTAR